MIDWIHTFEIVSRKWGESEQKFPKKFSRLNETTIYYVLLQHYVRFSFIHSNCSGISSNRVEWGSHGRHCSTVWTIEPRYTRSLLRSLQLVLVTRRLTLSRVGCRTHRSIWSIHHHMLKSITWITSYFISLFPVLWLSHSVGLGRSVMFPSVMSSWPCPLILLVCAVFFFISSSVHCEWHTTPPAASDYSYGFESSSASLNSQSSSGYYRCPSVICLRTFNTPKGRINPYVHFMIGTAHPSSLSLTVYRLCDLFQHCLDRNNFMITVHITKDRSLVLTSLFYN